MDSSRFHYPWYFFWRFTRLNFVLFLLIYAALVLFVPGHSNAFSVLIGSGFFLSCFTFYLITRPIKRLLGRVESIIGHDLPFREQLKLFYVKDEWAHIEAALKDADTKLRMQLKTIQDENRKFTTLLGSISNEILAVDANQNVLFFNPRFEASFLADKEKLQTGGKLWSVLDVAEARDVFETVLSTKVPQKLRGFKVKTQNEIRYYSIAVSPIFGENALIKGAVGVFSDITEVKLTEQMRADFVANVSHEIRTPLTSIKGFSQVLKSQQSKLPVELHDFIDRILHNTERMIALFNDLLNLSVIESKNQVEITRMDLDRMIEQIHASSRGIFPSKTVHLSCKLEIPEIQADEKLFYQLLNNLFENALKYGPEKIEITLTSQQVDKKVLITFSDNGPGIPREHLSRIFERFYRVDHSRDRETGGTGLGLAIAKHIIMKHQGEIEAVSDGVKGTSFRITLPA
jgi:two-component system phosphate regulon sensor histidine kinase PhoR